MHISDLFEDDRAFRANLTGAGVEKLKAKVKGKLMELMGDHTDDTLVEYVVVLLRNGRSKDEAKKELCAFLSDDTVPFVSWLWDHLSSNLHLYAERKASHHDDIAKAKSLANKNFGSHSKQPQKVSGRKQNDLEYEKHELTKQSANRHKKEWRGLVKEEIPSFLQIPLNLKHLEEKACQKTNFVGRFLPNKHRAHKKRHRQDEQQPTKKETNFYSSVGPPRQLLTNCYQRATNIYPSGGPPRRLLQFALRDAVRTLEQSSSRTEPAPKRLRSMVFKSSTDNFLVDRPLMRKPVSGASARAINVATAAAAKHVLEAKCSKTVFDRLSHDRDKIDTIDNSLYVTDDVREEGEFVDIYGFQGLDDITMLDEKAGSLHNDRCNPIGSLRKEGYSSVTENNTPFTPQYRVSKNTDRAKQTRIRNQESFSISEGKAALKVVNVSFNVSTWKPSEYGGSKKHAEADSLSTEAKVNVRTTKHNVHLSDTAFEKDNVMAVADDEELQKTVPSAPGSCSANRPCDDADSRIIFVSNVHFAATKDALSHHFSRFGDVLKVTILTDATTGQPKGLACIEFLLKESAEQALSLNGTYFMTRVLKAVRGNAAHHEGAPSPVMVRPQISRASLTAPMLRRAAHFPKVLRGGGFIPSYLRSHPQVKPGAFSLQWKRDASTAQPVESFGKASRSFTYIRSTS